MQASRLVNRSAKSKSDKERRWSIGIAMFVAWGFAGCEPDIGLDPVPEVMEFDISSDPARIPEPTDLLINPVTGLIDFSPFGLTLPADCEAQDLLSTAQCEFYQYLSTLDGFPTIGGARAPASAPLDLSTAGLGREILVFDATHERVLTEVNIAFDSAASYLTLAPQAGWRSVPTTSWPCVAMTEESARARAPRSSLRRYTFYSKRRTH